MVGRIRIWSRGFTPVRIMFAGMPLDLRHDAAWHVPACGLVAKVCVIPAHVVRRSANGAFEQMRDAASLAEAGSRT